MYKLFSIFLITSLAAFAQNEQVKIAFVPMYNNALIQIEKNYPFKNDSIEFENLKFYISNIAFYNDDNLVLALDKKQHLVNIAESKSLEIYTTSKRKNNFNNIRFNLGIDSITNVSGAMGGDLDPTKNMYWAWQSGYINFKLEGKTNLCPARNHFFQFHIGGYQQPYYCLQRIKLNVNNTGNVMIELDIEALLKQTDITKTYEIMSPSTNAMAMAQIISTLFKIKE